MSNITIENIATKVKYYNAMNEDAHLAVETYKPDHKPTLCKFVQLDFFGNERHRFTDYVDIRNAWFMLDGMILAETIREQG